MDKIKEFLQGKKTYILAGLTVIGVWADYFFGLGLSDACKATVEAAAECKVTFQQACTVSYAALTSATLRAAIAKV